MPRFYHQDNPDLSDLNRAKKSVNRDYAKQYQSQDNNHDNLGQTQDVDSLYNTLSTRLLALQTALQDLYNILEVGSGSPNFFSPQQRALLQQSASKILSEVGALQLIMSKIKGFNAFTPPQAQGLSSLVAEISALNDFINGIVSTLSEGVVGQQVADVVQTYQPQIKLLLQFLTGASSNYQSVEANPKTVETMSGGVAYHYHPTTMTGSGTNWDTMKMMGQYAVNNPETSKAILTTLMGGAIVPAYNGEGHFGSDGYRIGDFYTYSSPRRFY